MTMSRLFERILFDEKNEFLRFFLGEMFYLLLTIPKHWLAYNFVILLFFFLVSCVFSFVCVDGIGGIGCGKFSILSV